MRRYDKYDKINNKSIGKIGDYYDDENNVII